MRMRDFTRRGTRLALGLAGTGAAVLALAAPSSAASTLGPLVTWGANSGGQLGDGNFANVAAPITVTTPAGVTAAAAGEFHTLAVTAAGGLLAWGTNSSGQLGTGNQKSTEAPVPVSLPLKQGEKVTAVAAGDAFSLALTSAGRVLAWGANSNGQLGDTTGTTRTSPVPVALPPNTTVTAISAGPTFALALTSDGRILAWGQNNSGQLGNLSGNSSSTPVQVPLPASLPAGTKVTQIAAGGTRVTASAPGFGFGMALTSTGTVFEWGDDSQGELGRTASGPQLPATVTIPGNPVTSISAGSSSSYSLDASGTALAWGDNREGQLGTGSDAASSVTPAPMLLSGLKASQIVGDHEEVVVRTTSGQALAAGIAELDENGDGIVDVFATSTPVAVPFTGVRVTGLFTGPSADHVLALVVSSQ
jgi:alpha-tubulin suppressor-like RCC1 family protein